MRTFLVAALVFVGAFALVPAAEAGQPCTTPPKNAVDAVLWAAECRTEDVRDAADRLAPEVATTEIDLRWLTACPGPWGHEERTQVGPFVIVTYECDNGGT